MLIILRILITFICKSNNNMALLWKNDYKQYIVDKLRVRIPLEEMKYLLFIFLRTGNDAKRGVELRHSTLPRDFESVSK